MLSNSSVDTDYDCLISTLLSSFPVWSSIIIKSTSIWRVFVKQIQSKQGSLMCPLLSLSLSSPTLFSAHFWWHISNTYIKLRLNFPALFEFVYIFEWIDSWLIKLTGLATLCLHFESTVDLMSWPARPDYTWKYLFTFWIESWLIKLTSLATKPMSQKWSWIYQCVNGSNCCCDDHIWLQRRSSACRSWHNFQSFEYISTISDVVVVHVCIIF